MAVRGFLRDRRRDDAAERHARAERLRGIVADYRVGTLLDQDGAVPLTWWTHADNFGDLLSPWLVERMTGRRVALADRSRPHYLAIGSVLDRTSDHTIAWGSGSFGTERPRAFARGATYTAVRGPLTMARLHALDLECPAVYGDPALLTPAYFAPDVPITHEVGIVMRWSERRWRETEVDPDVPLIDLGSRDVEGVLEQMLSCRRIVSGSLHGLIIADAYGIANAWVQSPSAHGGRYKFFDYFSSVDKLRNPERLRPGRVTVERLLTELTYDDRPISYAYRPLLDACPFLERVDAAAPEPEAAGTRAPELSAT